MPIEWHEEGARLSRLRTEDDKIWFHGIPLLFPSQPSLRRTVYNNQAFNGGLDVAEKKLYSNNGVGWWPRHIYLIFSIFIANRFYMNKMKYRCVLFVSLIIEFVTNSSSAAIVDTVTTYSASMKKNIKAVVITPDTYANAKELPVVYLLHGHGGNYADWILKAKGFEKAVDLYNFIIVCPDGGSGSWYWDSPIDDTFKYETYIAKELVQWIDGKYKTIKSKSGRGITGLSMGGHGALYLAFKHQDIYGAAGSMSGGVDIRPFPDNWDMSKRLGIYAENPENWEKNTVINMLYLVRPKSLALIIDCGVDDFFYKVNENLHQQMLLRNISHDYTTRPGAHNWPYWGNAISYQLMFMNNYFRNK